MMILLVSGASATHGRYLAEKRLGWLRTPRSGNSIQRIVEASVPWAADNDCYQRLDRARYLRMLRQLACADRSRLLFVTAPDVVANADATLARFRLWQPSLAYLDLPVALVAQDGQEDRVVPWGQIRCLFIGGSTRWKLSGHAQRLIVEANARGKWVHVGRINTLRRMWLFSSLPVDSFDGTAFSKMPDTYIPWMLRRLDGVQHVMEDTVWSLD